MLRFSIRWFLFWWNATKISKTSWNFDDPLVYTRRKRIAKLGAKLPPNQGTSSNPVNTFHSCWPAAPQHHRGNTGREQFCHLVQLCRTTPSQNKTTKLHECWPGVSGIWRKNFKQFLPTIAFASLRRKRLMSKVRAKRRQQEKCLPYLREQTWSSIMDHNHTSFINSHDKSLLSIC